MAKKRTYPAPAKKQVSVRKIVEGLDKVLGEIETTYKSRSSAPPTREIERARKALLAARSAVESACLPEFYLPSE
jgi:hypothetical protein